MTPKPPLRIAILGAGPIGLEAALYARTLGHAVSVFEQGAAGEHVGRWGHIRMFTPFSMNITPLGRRTLLTEHPPRDLPADADILTGKEFRDAYLTPLGESTALRGCLQPQTAVLTVGRAGWRKTDPVDAKKPLPPFRLLVRAASGAERFETADVILDCTGTFARPNWAGDGGIPAAGEIAARPQAAYWPDDILGAKKPHYAGKSIVLIGSGYSAATTIAALATLAEEHQSTWVFWLSHGPRAAPLPRLPNDLLRERDRLAMRANALACRPDGNLEFHAQTVVDELLCHGLDKGFRVAGRTAGKAVSWDVDRVIVNVGYRPDMTLCQELRVAEPAGEIATAEPGYYLLGAKSRGRDSAFLLKDGHEQIRRAFAMIQGNAKLDLYAAKVAA